MIPLLLLPPEFFTFVFGQEFGDLTRVILLLSPGILLYNIALIIGHYFSGTGKYHVNSWANFSGLLTTILFSIYVIPRYGLTEGALIATASYFITALVVVIAFIRETSFSFADWMIGRNDFSSAIKEIKGIFAPK
jgi:O-antigen/teichoic acid export membrane protein